jgi:hypothetical protein
MNRGKHGRAATMLPDLVVVMGGSEEHICMLRNFMQKVLPPERARECKDWGDEAAVKITMQSRIVRVQDAPAGLESTHEG